MGRVLGYIAVIVAIVAIFVPINGILVSVLAVLIAAAAAFAGEDELAFITSGVVALNSFFLSPLLWLLVMWPGQLVIAGYVLGIVSVPLLAVAIRSRFFGR